MPLNIGRVFTRTSSADSTTTKGSLKRRSTHEHAKHAPLPFLASPVDPAAQQWVQRKARGVGQGLQRARTVAQFHEEHGDESTESAFAKRIFRKQHEASTLELFFDLFFVANLAVFTTKSAHVDFPSLANYMGFFAILWTTWFHFSMFDVRFYVDSVFTRICKFATFGIMVSFVGLNPMYDAILTHRSSRSFQSLALVLLSARILLIIQYAVVVYFTRKFQRTLVPMCLTMVVYLAVGMGFLATYLEDRGVDTLAGHHGARHVMIWYILIAVEALACIIISCVWRVMSFKHTHLVERFGLLTLIVSGEGIIGLVKSCSYAIQGTEVTIISETGIVTSAVLIIYLIYVLYFDNIDHHRFGTIGQQVWTLLHYPAHCAILLTVEGSTALIIWNAVRCAIAWVIEDNLPSQADPAKGLATAADFITRVNETYYKTAARYNYKILSEYYPTFNDDLAKLSKTKNAYGTPEWKGEVAPVLKKMGDYYQYFLYQNFGAEGPNYKLKKEKDYGKKVQLFEDGFKFTMQFFYVSAGALLIVFALLYWFGRQRKTRTEWTSIGIRLLAGMALPLTILSTLNETPGSDNSFRFQFSYLLIPVVALGYLVVIIVDNTIKGISERHYTIVEERRMSQHASLISGNSKNGVIEEEIELEDEDHGYGAKRDVMHGSPQMVNDEYVQSPHHAPDEEHASLTRNAQSTPTVSFGGAGSRGYAEVGQHDDSEVTEYRGYQQQSHR